MKHFFIILLSLFLIGCGSDPDSVAPSDILNEDLTEFGSNPEEDNENLEENPFMVVNACDVFEDTRHGLGAEFQKMYKRLHAKCETLSVERQEALFVASSFANRLFDEMVESENPALCLKLAKRAVRKAMTYHRRTQKIANGHEKSELLELRNTVTKERIDRLLRRLYQKGCVEQTLEEIDYSFDDVERVFAVNENHIVNGSFELFNNIYDEQKGTSYLNHGWTIVESSKFPGWRIREVNPVEDGKNCAFLEVQTAGVVTSAPHGNQIVELDSHCTNAQGRRVSGDSNVEIFQKFPVTESGTYSLRFKAQRRSGRYGNLEVAVYQNKRDKTYSSYDLVDSAEWVNVCQQVEISEEEKNVSVSLRDAGDDGRATYGILLDQVEFVKGPCL